MVGPTEQASLVKGDPHGDHLVDRMLGREVVAAHDLPAAPIDDEIDLPVQVNGKLRATPKAPKDAGKDQLEAVARAAVAAHLEGKEVLKVVVVPGRLVNFVVKG